MKEIEEILKKALKTLEAMDCTNYNFRLENQKKLNQVYTEIEKAREMLKKYE